jgi:hypothetical protein
MEGDRFSAGAMTKSVGTRRQNRYADCGMVNCTAGSSSGEVAV